MREKPRTTMTTEPLKTVRHRREDPGTRYPGHNATVIEIDGELVEVDTRILELVRIMNTIPGLTTTGSCRGGRGPRYMPGYVSFKGLRACRFVTGMAKIMAELCGDLQPRGIGNDMPLFSTEEGIRPCVRWQPPVYPLVLRAAKQISKQTFKPPPGLVDLLLPLDSEQLQRYCSALISSLYNRLGEDDRALIALWSKHVNNAARPPGVNPWHLLNIAACLAFDSLREINRGLGREPFMKDIPVRR
jgi:hypothetical protein